MGFTSGTAVTVDSDLTKFFFEQRITQILASGETFTALHLGVVDEHIAWLESERGIGDASTITNESAHKPLLVAMMLEKIFAGITPRGGDGTKAAYYAGKVVELRRTLPVRTSANRYSRRGLPKLVNVEAGSRFPAAGGSPGDQVARSKMPNFDDHVIEGV